MEALYAAVAAGADAVYCGGQQFSARASAKNFNRDELRRAVLYCHLHGVKIYVTVNVLLYDKELREAMDFCRFLCDIGADAVITADVGLISLIAKELPGLSVHASTQFSAHSSEGVDFAASLGAERVVVARELSKENIAACTENAAAETEMFLHGALCVCHSGQCLFSSLVGGRSGNRGTCAQPCRLPYNGGYPLSLKDLSLARRVPELIASGVSSLKIEGRMKAPAYVYGVTRIYRRLLDENRAATDDEEAELDALFSRGGFTDGYYAGRITRPMTGTRTEDAKRLSRDYNDREFFPRRVKISAKARIASGEKCKLSFTYKGVTVAVEGDVPMPAQSKALGAEDVYRSAAKLGSTFFALDAERAEITVEDGLFLPMGALHALRREAAEKLESAFLRPLEGKTEKKAPAFAKRELGKMPRKLRTAIFYLPETYAAMRERDYFDLAFLPLFAPWDREGFPAFGGVALPPVVTDGERGEVLSRMKAAAEMGVKWALLENPAQLALCREADLLPFGDFRFNITNREAMAVWQQAGLLGFVLSPELTLPQLRDLAPGSAVVYGRVPLMITERCFVKENGGCEACGKFVFTDRTGAKFPVLREYPHRNLIFNSLPTYMGDREKELEKYGITRRHFIFSMENAKEADGVVAAWRAGAPMDGRRIVKDNGA